MGTPTTFFQDNLVARYVPEMYKNGEYNGIVALLQFLAPFLDEGHEDIINLPQLAQLPNCPPQFLPYLAELLGWSPPAGMDGDSLRRELGKTVDIYRNRGNAYSFGRVFKYTGALEYGIYLPYQFLFKLGESPLGTIYRMEDAVYWRVGTLDVYSDSDPMIHRSQVEDLQPVATKLYYTYLNKYYITDSGTAASETDTAIFQSLFDGSLFHVPPTQIGMQLEQNDIYTSFVNTVLGSMDFARPDIGLNHTDIFFSDTGVALNLYWKTTISA